MMSKTMGTTKRIKMVQTTIRSLEAEVLQAAEGSAARAAAQARLDYQCRQLAEWIEA